jgi:hypothetical protein
MSILFLFVCKYSEKLDDKDGLFYPNHCRKTRENNRFGNGFFKNNLLVSRRELEIATISFD